MKKRMFWIPMIFFAFLLLCYGIVNAYALASGREKIFEYGRNDLPEETYDAILVLGAGVRSNGTPSNMLEDRLLTALALYEAGLSQTVIVSGDHGSAEYDEVNVMKDYLIGEGVPSERIFMDHAGFSTYDSLYRAKAIFGARSLAVVTQKYHSYRALMIGEWLGLDCKGFAAPILSSSSRAYPHQTWYSFRESIARCKDFLYCVFRPEPSYLGDPISLSGSGDITNDR